MCAFVIVDTLIENADKLEEYKQLTKPIAEKYGGDSRGNLAGKATPVVLGLPGVKTGDRHIEGV